MDNQQDNNFEEDDRSIRLFHTLLIYMTSEGVDFEKCKMMEDICSTDSIVKNACRFGDTEIKMLRQKCAQEKQKFSQVFMLNLTTFVKKNSFMNSMFWNDTSFHLGIYLQKNAVFKEEETSPYFGLTRQGNVFGSPFLTRQVSLNVMRERFTFQIHLDESMLTKLKTEGLVYEDLSRQEQNALVKLRQSISLEDNVNFIPLINAQSIPIEYRITQRGEVNYELPWHVETSKNVQLIPKPPRDTHSGITWDLLECMAL